MLPSSLQSLTFGASSTPNLEGVSLPSSLQSLTFADNYDDLEGVTLPSGLRSLTFGEVGEGLFLDEEVWLGVLPGSLQKLTFGNGYNPNFNRVELPSMLHVVANESLTMDCSSSRCDSPVSETNHCPTACSPSAGQSCTHWIETFCLVGVSQNETLRQIGSLVESSTRLKGYPRPAHVSAFERQPRLLPHPGSCFP